MLVALTSAARGSEICFLNINYFVRHSSGHVFQFGRNTKTSKEGKPGNPIRCRHFEENRSLCVCNHIDLYTDKTKDFRHKESQLLLSFIKPEEAVSTQCQDLGQAGIDTKTFS